MKYANLKTSDGSSTVQFTCPHCDVDAEIDDGSIVELWTHFSGQVTCPPPVGCNKQHEIPSIEEVKKLRAQLQSDAEARAQEIMRRAQEDAEKAVA